MQGPEVRAGGLRSGRIKFCASCFVRTLWRAYLLTTIVAYLLTRPCTGESPHGGRVLSAQVHQTPGAPLQTPCGPSVGPPLSWAQVTASDSFQSNPFQSWRPAFLLIVLVSPFVTLLTRCYACPPLGLHTASFRPVVYFLVFSVRAARVVLLTVERFAGG